MRRSLVGCAIVAVAISLTVVLWSAAPTADEDWIMGDIGRVATALGVGPNADGKYDVSEILCEVLARLDIDCSTGASCFIHFDTAVDVYRGNTACLQISTVPGSVCSIQVTLPSGSVSQASGLSTQTADSSGNVIWSWLVSGNTGPGEGTIHVAATTPSGESCTAETEWIVSQK